MDAAALLKSQGWRGKGFSLHPTNNTIGLSKPLLISRNTDGRGIGQKAHYTSDQWWLHAFDQKLKGLDTSKKGTVTQSVTQGKLDVIASSQPNGKYTGVSGLYASFVRGGMLEGTMMEIDLVAGGESTDATPVTSSEESDGSVSRRMRRRQEKRGESKAERHARRAARAARKAEKAARKAADAKAARKAIEKAAKKAAKKELKKATRADETKEERRARRGERRARKEVKRRKREAATLQKSDQG
jgi:nucleolar protein TMA23